ncbi:MAG: hypothetical protein H6706_26870 [Myxococcales bacterium]|nr:hypothetical protein [Myxococcales bacterium]
MTEIKGPRAIGAVGAPSPASPSQAAQGAAPAAAAAPPDELGRLFSAVADRLATGAIADREAAVRAAVDAVLAREMASLPAPTRDRVAADVAGMLLARPDLAERMDRLLGLPG